VEINLIYLDGKFYATSASVNPDPTKKLRCVRPWSACRKSFSRMEAWSATSLTVSFALHGAKHSSAGLVLRMNDFFHRLMSDRGQEQTLVPEYDKKPCRRSASR
jgi:hypothetical protein